MARGQHKLRVIAGQWKGRMLPFNTAPDLRPTASKTRETLFNWLMMDVPNARVLDAFAGSGLLGIEALSRGAMQVDFIEKAKPAVQQLRQNLTNLAADPQRYAIYQQDALKFFTRPSATYDIVFLDPPFKGVLLSRSLELLSQSPRPLLQPYGKLYVETANSDTMDALANHPVFNVIKQSRSGDAHAFLLQYRDAF